MRDKSLLSSIITVIKLIKIKSCQFYWFDLRLPTCHMFPQNGDLDQIRPTMEFPWLPEPLESKSIFDFLQVVWFKYSHNFSINLDGNFAGFLKMEKCHFSDVCYFLVTRINKGIQTESEGVWRYILQSWWHNFHGFYWHHWSTKLLHQIM